jgi:hypothetical protein
VLEICLSPQNHTLTLPLPAVAIDISIPRHDGSDYVFGSHGAVNGWSFTKLVLDNRIAAEGEPLLGWRLHDLRRTMRSGLGRLGVRPDVAELLVVNPAKGGIRAIYDRYSYEREIKTALVLWADHVLAVVEEREPRIVPLRDDRDLK